MKMNVELIKSKKTNWYGVVGLFAHIVDDKIIQYIVGTDVEESLDEWGHGTYFSKEDFEYAEKHFDSYQDMIKEGEQ